jgi:hypothetical protein
MSKRPNTAKNQANITDFTKRTDGKHTPIGTRFKKQTPANAARELKSSFVSARNMSRTTPHSIEQDTNLEQLHDELIDTPSNSEHESDNESHSPPKSYTSDQEMEETEWSPENEQENHRNPSDFPKDGESCHSNNSNTDSVAFPSQQSTNSPTPPPNVEREDRNDFSQMNALTDTQTNATSQTRQEAASIINKLTRNRTQTFTSQRSYHAGRGGGVSLRPQQILERNSNSSSQSSLPINKQQFK